MTLRRQFLIGSACALLVACGGGDTGGSSGSGGSAGQNPDPSPSPTPTPSPILNPEPGFGTLGVTTNQAYASLGFLFKYLASEWDLDPVADSTVIDYPIQLRFTQPDNLWLSLDGSESRLVANGSGGWTLQGQQIEGGYAISGGRVSLQAPARRDGTRMKHTGLAYWSITTPTDNVYSGGHFVYGTATASNALPMSGIGRYTNQNPDQAPLFVDFATAQVTGEFSLPDWYFNNPANTYVLQDVRISDDRTRFAGDLTLSGEKKGRVEGRFNGPSGVEMMVRYSFAPGGPEPAAFVTVAARE